jgi:hypothetical protein
LDDMSEAKEAMEREVQTLRSRLNRQSVNLSSSGGWRDRLAVGGNSGRRRPVPGGQDGGDDTTDDGASERSIAQE